MVRFLMRLTVPFLLLLLAGGPRGTSVPSSPASMEGAASRLDYPVRLDRIAVRPVSGMSLEKALAGFAPEKIRRLPGLATAVVEVSTRKQSAGKWVAQLQATGRFEVVEPVYVAAASGGCGCAGGDGPSPHEEEISELGLEKAWERTTGDGRVTVALLDTGVDLGHPDLRPNLLPGWDFVDNDAVPNDVHGHGTAVCGILGARGGNGVGTAGVSWNVRILPVRVADGNGRAAYDTLARGLVYAADRGADIITISLGAPASSELLREAVDYATDRGALVLAAAGNENVLHAMHPAGHPEVVAVGASDKKGRSLGYQTAFAPSIRLFAPGEALLTTAVRGLYDRITGTSASVAYASGTCALLLSLRPDLTAAQLRALLLAGRRPLEGFETLPEARHAGVLDPVRVLEQLENGGVGLLSEGIDLLPSHPVVGRPARVRIRLLNAGLDSVQVQPRVSVSGEPVGRATAPIGLSPGEARAVEIPVRFSQVGEQKVTVSCPMLGEASWDATVRVGEAPRVDWAIDGVSVGAFDYEAERVTLNVRIENRGPSGPTPDLEVRVDDTLVRLEGGVRLETGAGLTRSVRVTAVPTSEGPIRTAECRLEGPDDVRRRDNRVLFPYLTIPVDPAPVGPQYQQSSGVDVVMDAPYRLDPDRAHLPVMFFVPNRGSRGPNTHLECTEVKLTSKDQPDVTVAGRLLYHDENTVDIRNQRGRFVSGLVALDEMGRIVVDGTGRPDPNFFRDKKLTRNGRHLLLRVPRQGFGVSRNPSRTVVKYLHSTVEWRAKRRFLYFWRKIRKGSHQKVLRVRFAKEKLPAFKSRKGQYYDCHFHTIAEWYFANPYNILAPRKNYGGPLTMLAETAHAIGFTDSPRARPGDLVTTDHNTFYNTRAAAANGPELRPPFGPTAPGNSVGPGGRTLTELERMRQLFGELAGEEVTFHQRQWVVAPIGAHMLAFRGDHVEGPWHGGSALSQSLGGSAPIELRDVLKNYAGQTGMAGGEPFCYSAHPFDEAYDWSKKNMEMAMNLKAGQRSRDFVHQGREFVFKGHQIWNQKDTRHLPNKRINWRRMNPWADPDFQQTDPSWDGELMHGLVAYHRALAEQLVFAFDNEPERTFVRKQYILAGTDAHGDFNYYENRLATPLNLKNSFTVSDNAYGRCRTYVLLDENKKLPRHERAARALSDGRCILTDGPLLEWEMDADGRFDSETLAYHDGRLVYENRDGEIGGGGRAFDGGRTMLAVAGSLDPVHRFRWTNTDEHGGPITHIKVYKNEPNQPNPSQQRPAALGGAWYPRGIGELTPGAPNTWTSEPLDPREEGPFLEPTAMMLGAFTGPDDLDQGPIGTDEGRCFTNPIWTLPVAVDVSTGKPKKTSTPSGVVGTLPAGALRVRFSFATSMESRPLQVELKALDATGTSTDGSLPPITTLVPARGSGWSASGGVDGRVYEVVNQRPIPLNLVRYPAGGNEITFVLYFRDAPVDVNGNVLNRVATTFRMDGIGTGGGTGAPTATAASGSSAGSAAAAAVAASGGRSSGGCHLQRRAGDSPYSPLLLLLGGCLLVLLRRRRRQSRPIPVRSGRGRTSDQEV